MLYPRVYQRCYTHGCCTAEVLPTGVVQQRCYPRVYQRGVTHGCTREVILTVCRRDSGIPTVCRRDSGIPTGVGKRDGSIPWVVGGGTAVYRGWVVCPRTVILGSLPPTIPWVHHLIPHLVHAVHAVTVCCSVSRDDALGSSPRTWPG